MPVAETGRAIIARYNAMDGGGLLEVVVSELNSGLRMSLLEAGARHRGERRSDGSWRLTVEGGRAPAQGSVPGVHHVIHGSNGSLWACERGHRVARIDTGAGELAAVRAVTRKASHLALDERAGRVFVADAEAGEIVALNACDLSEVARWPAPGGPQLPLVSADGIVCVTGGATGSVTLAWPGAGTYRTMTFAVGASPHDPALDRRGEYLFVPCAGESALVKLRLADGAIVGRVAVGDGPSHLAIHPDGTRLYSANSWDGSVSCVTVNGECVGQASSGGWAHAIDISPDGRWVYVANFMDDTVAVFDAPTLERVALLDTDRYPHGLDVSPDGRYLVATGFASDHLRIFDAVARRELARIEVGWGSSHTAFAPDGHAWIGCSVSDHIACVDLEARACTARLCLPDDVPH
jgi:YVTN family beta-propeller protein